MSTDKSTIEISALDKSVVEKSKSAIERIEELSAVAGTAWYSLLGCVAFVAVTLLSITHADVILDSRMIKLPIVPVEVPTGLFLSLASVVTMALTSTSTST